MNATKYRLMLREFPFLGEILDRGDGWSAKEISSIKVRTLSDEADPVLHLVPGVRPEVSEFADFTAIFQNGSRRDLQGVINNPREEVVDCVGAQLAEFVGELRFLVLRGGTYDWHSRCFVQYVRIFRLHRRQ